MTMILRKGHNCYDIRPANRFSLLVDGQAYFTAFHSSLLKARQSALLLGWDFHSRTALLRNKEGPDPESTLRKVLHQATESNPDLHAWVLSWDYAMLYALEREPLAVFNFAWRAGSRLHFHMDGEHPMGASHHQKITVLDDAAAYVGGLDLTQHRWDTPEHKENDPRRQAPSGEFYPPFHDMQAVVDGQAARAVGDLARRRWYLATGEELPPPDDQAADTWPDHVTPDLRDIQVGVARTEPRFKGRPEIREIEQLYVDAIKASRKCIYIENQYLTASRVVDALAGRLAEEHPPEVVAVLPRHCSGWLEEQVMHSLRADALQRIQEADKENRFRIFYPAVRSSGEPGIKVHGKCLIVDNTFLTLGSANISNRSMGLDTEANLALEADTNEHRQGIEGLRLRLLAEHLGVGASDLRGVLQEQDSILAAIDRLNTNERRLIPLEEEIAATSSDLPPDVARRLDPEQPVAFDTLLDEVSEESPDVQRGPGQLTLALIALGVAALVVLWRHSPWGSLDAAQEVALFVANLRNQPATLGVLMTAYILGGVAYMPVTVLIVLTVLLYQFPQSPLLAVAGCGLSALAGYAAGRLRGSHYARKKARPGMNKLSRLLATRTLSSLVLVRLVPLTPFGLVNVVAGASRIHFWQYLAGTALGMAPGIVALTVFAEGLKQTLLSPSWVDAALLLLTAGGIVAGMALLARRLQQRKANAPLSSEEAA